MTEESTKTYCYRHPETETALRCNRCGNYICPKCARRTPTGYRCPDCIREQQKVFDTARWYDPITGFFTAAILAGIAGALFNLVGGFGFGFFLFFIIFAAGAGAGTVIAEAVRTVVGKRRSKILFTAATAGVVFGGLIANLHILLVVLFTGNLGSLLGLLWPGIFIFLAASATYVRLSGIQLGR